MAEFKRLNIRLPDSVYSELEDMAKSSGRSMTDVLRTALGLAKLAFDESKEGNKLTISDKQGKVKKEIVLTL